ncbi:hypothetical protein JFV26_28385 [Pseudomonas sp. TH31]|nr:hypothetical protein [Pseudomonas sp. TH31]
MGQVFAVCGSFFQYTIDEGLTSEANPIRSVKQKSNYKQRNTVMSSGKALTPLQWNYVIETAEVMAAEDPRHERTLFIVATLFSLYLRISDLVGRDNWKPTMGSFEFDGENWWFNVVGKGNKSAKVGVRDEYIEDYLKRYRTTLSLPSLGFGARRTELLLKRFPSAQSEVRPKGAFAASVCLQRHGPRDVQPVSLIWDGDL